MAAIEIRGVTKTYTRGEEPAVRDLSLHIPDGQFVVLVGPSGCGKSTTLRMIAGLEEPETGEIRIGGKVVNGVPPQRRDTAFVFQSYALYPHMTARQNMGFPLKMRKMQAEEILNRVEEVASIVGLERLLDRYPGQLSGGERQRVALGRAIVRQPAAFLLDEPLSNLDAQLRAGMRVELTQLQRQLGTTFVFVTHDQVEALTLADLLAVMHKGILQQTGTPEEIYKQPANRFIAGFIGSPRMNFMDGRLSSSNGETFLEADGFALPIGSRSPTIDTPDSKVTLGIRPEHLYLADSGPLEMMVEIAQSQGSQTFIYGHVGNGQHVTVGVASEGHPNVGDRTMLTVDLEHIHLFHPETGMRLSSN